MAQPDVLLALRAAITSNQAPILSTSADENAPPTTSLSQATHLCFAGSAAEHIAYPLSTLTRFQVNDNAVDLRSVFVAWQNQDASAQDYIQSVLKINEELSSSGSTAKVLNLPFAERLDLNSWLSGQQEDSEYIPPLEGAAAQAAASAGDSGATGAKRSKDADPRLEEIYKGERRICDRNSILHGIKPTDFSHVRKQVQSLFGKSKSRVADPVAQTALVQNLKKPNQRPQPIILVSPSASSLLRLTNIKKFLEEGVYVPADSDLASHSGANRLHIARNMQSIDPNRSLQFALMERTDQFRPDSWSRVVAVFTTGQEWQFKSYKWSTAQELFARTLGVYIGYTGDSVPDNVKKWGRIVKVLEVDKWNQMRGEQGRWRDREVVENIWTSIEESMRIKGWTKETGFKA
jgi:parafibromin